MEENKNTDTDKDFMSLMKTFQGTEEEPKVGIFWYNYMKEELFDIQSTPVSQIKISNGLGTHPRLHQDYWKKKMNRARTKNETDSIYLQDYTLIPRGRIFIKDNRFKLCVGSWIDGYKGKTNIREILIDLVTFTFDIPENLLDINISTHWDIGHGWSEYDFAFDVPKI